MRLIVSQANVLPLYHCDLIIIIIIILAVFSVILQNNVWPIYYVAYTSIGRGPQFQLKILRFRSFDSVELDGSNL